VVLSGATHELVLLGLVDGSGVVLDILLLVLLGLLPGLGLEVVVVGRPLLAVHPHHRKVGLRFGAGVEHLHGEVIELLVLVELCLAEDEDFGVSAQILPLMLISLPGLLEGHGYLFLGSVLPALAGHHAFLDLLVPLGLHVLLPLLGGVDQVERIVDEVLLDVPVQGGVCGEAGSVVDFQQVGVELVVDHHVKPQHLEAHVVGEVLRVDGGNRGAESWVARDDGLDDDVVDLLLEGVHVFALVGHVLENGGE